MSLRASGIAVRRGGRLVLDGVDLAVDARHLVAIVGPNGAGKSTLLSALAGDLPLAAGQILLDGRALADWSPHECARRRAVLPQQSSLDFPFRVREVVALGRTPYGRPSRADLDVAAAALEQVGLSAMAERRYTRLSGGERQRVHLARALTQVWLHRVDGQHDDANRSRTLLLDEPTAAQDLASSRRVLGCARRFADAGGAVLCVLHALDEAARYADIVCVLAAGRVVACGPPADVLVADTIEAAWGVPVHIFHPPGIDHPVVIAR